MLAESAARRGFLQEALKPPTYRTNRARWSHRPAYETFSDTHFSPPARIPSAVRFMCSLSPSAVCVPLMSACPLAIHSLGAVAMCVSSVAVIPKYSVKFGM